MCGDKHDFGNNTKNDNCNLVIPIDCDYYTEIFWRVWPNTAYSLGNYSFIDRNSNKYDFKKAG